MSRGRSVEREISSGQTHTYRISLAAGQFLRATIEPKGFDASLTWIAPDGKQILEVNLNTTGRLAESLSSEASSGGEHRLEIRAAGSGRDAGSYRVNSESRAAATPEDKQRIAAERLLNEASSAKPNRETPRLSRRLKSRNERWRYGAG